MKVDAVAPDFTRFPVQFSNWRAFGYVVSPEKLLTDVTNFRHAAKLLRSIKTKDADAAAGMLENLAGQWEGVAEES